MKIKLSDKQDCRLTFTHLNGNQASLYVARNPLTGAWLQDHKVGDKGSAYYGTKAAAVSLVNDIVSKSKEKNLPCKVEINTQNYLT